MHCQSEAEDQHMLEVLKDCFQSWGIELHPVKTKIVSQKANDKQEADPALDKLNLQNIAPFIASGRQSHVASNENQAGQRILR